VLTLKGKIYELLLEKFGTGAETPCSLHKHNLIINTCFWSQCLDSK